MSRATHAVIDSQSMTVLQTRLDALESENAHLKSQLDWFKRQLFGERSEKRLLIEPAIQADLLASLGGVAAPAPPPALEKISYQRRKRRGDNSVTGQGLRFDDSVPVETIRVNPPPDLACVPADEQVLISEKVSYRLAQRPGSYVILKYVRPVIKHRDSDVIITAPAPDNVLDKSIADVSFLAGMLVDKFVYYLPLYRQHQRLRQCGIELSRSTL
ncbi:MAG: transposase, partial [Wenzhouxiangellaceae bacterium]